MSDNWLCPSKGCYRLGGEMFGLLSDLVFIPNVGDTVFHTPERLEGKVRSGNERGELYVRVEEKGRNSVARFYKGKLNLKKCLNYMSLRRQFGDLYRP